MFTNKLNWIINCSGMTHLVLPYNTEDDNFWFQVQEGLRKNKLNFEEIFNQHYPGIGLENIHFFEKAMEYKPDTTRSQLNHILFIPNSDSITEIRVQHQPKMGFNTSGILIIDSLFSVSSKLKGIISATIKNIPEFLEFRILYSYGESIGFFDNMGWGKDV